MSQRLAAGMTAEDFARAFDVSRETIDRLEAYKALLQRWNARINLVAPATLSEVWSRHFADSAQLLALAPDTARSWVDLGSGAGFPGLVIAAMAAEKQPDLSVRLIESDARKAVFLSEAARKMGLTVKVDACRIESVPSEPHDVVSARALAPLSRLCELASRFAGPGTVFLFLKGAALDTELTVAARDWHIRAERVTSMTEPAATILRITELKPRT